MRRVYSFHNYLIVLSLLTLSACGFTPLHQKQADLTDRQVFIGQMEISRIADREGQIVRNHLIDLMDPVHQGKPPQPDSFLNVRLDISKTSLAVRKDGTTSRYQINVDAFVILTDKDRKKQLLNEKVRAINSYSIGELSAGAAYSTAVSEKDALHKTLRLIAEEINMLVKSYSLRKNAL